jgi:hypothetical protein
MAIFPNNSIPELRIVQAHGKFLIVIKHRDVRKYSVAEITKSGEDFIYWVSGYGHVSPFEFWFSVARDITTQLDDFWLYWNIIQEKARGFTSDQDTARDDYETG